MNRSKLVAGARGVGAAIAKRLIYVGFALLVFQLLSVQYTLVSSDDRQAEQGRERLRKALEENQREHLKTQRYIRCIVLLPVAERTEENFAKCGETGKVEPLINSEAFRQAATESSTAPTARTMTVTTSSPPDTTTSPTLTPTPAGPGEPAPQQARLLGPLLQPTIDILDGQVIGPVLGGLGQ